MEAKSKERAGSNRSGAPRGENMATDEKVKGS